MHERIFLSKQFEGQDGTDKDDRCFSTEENINQDSNMSPLGIKNRQMRPKLMKNNPYFNSLLPTQNKNLK